MTDKKIMVLDGISGVPLAQEFTQALQAEGARAQYADLKSFPSKSFYAVKGGLKKLLNRWESRDSFYHAPRLSEQCFEAFIAQEKPAVLLIIGFVYKYLNPKFLLALKQKYGFKLYLYDTDSCNLYSRRREFLFFIEQELPVYDEILSFSKVTTKFFRETRGLNASFFPFGSKLQASVPIGAPKLEVLFVGSCDLRRIFLLEQIAPHVQIYGDRWTRNLPLISRPLANQVHDEGLWGGALYQKLNDAKIVLNITRTHFYGAETGVNLRIFEALSAGCFLLTDYCDELAEMFEIGKEIEVFRSGKELAEKVDYYLANPEARMRIAKLGREKFLREYSWNMRAKDLLARV